MTFSAFRGMKPFSQLLFSAFVIIVCFLAFMVLSVIVAIPVFGLDSMMSIPTLNDLGNPGSVNLLKYFQVVQSIGLFIVPPMILGLLFLGNIKAYLYLNRSTTFSSFLLVIILVISASPFINFLGELNSQMHFPEWLSGIERWMQDSEDKADKLTEVFLNVNSLGGLLFNLFMIAVLPAIGEELLFRGVIQRIFTNMTKSHHWGIWISAILFSALHMQFFGFIPRMLLGVLFGYLLVWSGTMWLPMIAHFVNNGVAVILWYFIHKNMISPEMENIGTTSDSYYWVILSLILIAVLMWIIKRENKENRLTLNDLQEY